MENEVINEVGTDKLVQLDFPILTKRQNQLLETYINKQIIRELAKKGIRESNSPEQKQKWKKIYLDHKYLHFNTSQRSSIHKIKNKLINYFKTNKEMIKIIKNNNILTNYLDMREINDK
jgi:hypothetical protein